MAYDMVPQDLLIECLKMYKISEKVIKFITKTMKSWKMKSTLLQIVMPSLSVIAMMPLNYLGDTLGGNKF